MSIANKFISWPNKKFFLRHVVQMNYAGKVYTVLRGIEVAHDTTGWNQALFVCYAVFMTLGMFWYTRFWLLPRDLDDYYRESDHVLRTVGNMYITFGAAVYYLVFCILFSISYTSIDHPVSLSLAIWNAWCCILLILAI